MIAGVVTVNHGREQGLTASALRQMFFSRLPVRNALFVFALAMLLTGIGLRAPKGWQAMMWRSGLPAVVAPAPGQLVKQPAFGAYDPGHAFAGPALIDSRTSTILVPDSFDASIDEDRNVILHLRDATGVPTSARLAEQVSA